jgi:hypothetical protein
MLRITATVREGILRRGMLNVVLFLTSQACGIPVRPTRETPSITECTMFQRDGESLRECREASMKSPKPFTSKFLTVCASRRDSSRP